MKQPTKNTANMQIQCQQHAQISVNVSTQMLSSTKRIAKNETIPSDIIYGGYNSETSVLRLSLTIRLKHTRTHTYIPLWC